MVHCNFSTVASPCDRARQMPCTVGKCTLGIPRSSYPCTRGCTCGTELLCLWMAPAGQPQTRAFVGPSPSAEMAETSTTAQSSVQLLRESLARGKALAAQDAARQAAERDAETAKADQARLMAERRRSYGRVQRRAASPAAKVKRPTAPASPVRLHGSPSRPTHQGSPVPALRKVDGKKRGPTPQGTPHGGGPKKRGPVNGPPRAPTMESGCTTPRQRDVASHGGATPPPQHGPQPRRPPMAPPPIAPPIGPQPRPLVHSEPPPPLRECASAEELLATADDDMAFEDLEAMCASEDARSRGGVAAYGGADCDGDDAVGGGDDDDDDDASVPTVAPLSDRSDPESCKAESAAAEATPAADEMAPPAAVAAAAAAEAAAAAQAAVAAAEAAQAALDAAAAADAADGERRLDDSDEDVRDFAGSSGLSAAGLEATGSKDQAAAMGARAEDEPAATDGVRAGLHRLLFDRKPFKASETPLMSPRQGHMTAVPGCRQSTAHASCGAPSAEAPAAMAASAGTDGDAAYDQQPIGASQSPQATAPVDGSPTGRDGTATQSGGEGNGSGGANAKPVVRRVERGSLFARLRLGGQRSPEQSHDAAEAEDAKEQTSAADGPEAAQQSASLFGGGFFGGGAEGTGAQQQLEAMSEQLEAVTACMRVEQQARCAAETQLEEAREQLQSVLKHLASVEAIRKEEASTLSGLRGLLGQLQSENDRLKEQNGSLVAQCRSYVASGRSKGASGK